MPTYNHSTLERVTSALFEAAGAPPAIARTVAASLVLSNRLGHDSHGILRVPRYIEQIREGRLDPTATGTVVREAGTVALMDGGWGFGQIAAMEAARYAVARARESAIAAVGVYHLNHVGRLGEYTEMAASEGFIAIAFNGGTPEGAIPNVAPFGGARAVWGTNPLAVAIPAEGVPFSLDFATSIIAGGKAAVARSKGESLAEGQVIDSEGHPTTDPRAVIQGGAILPFGQHKGYGLAFAVELLAGSLIGAAAPELRPDELATGFLFIACDPAAFRPAEAFRRSVDVVRERVKACPPAAGFEEVLVPGEPEHRHRLAADERGIFVPESVRLDLEQLGQELGVSLEW